MEDADTPKTIAVILRSLAASDKLALDLAKLHFHYMDTAYLQVFIRLNLLEERFVFGSGPWDDADNKFHSAPI